MAAHPSPSVGAQQFELIPDCLVRGVSDWTGSGRKGGRWCVCPFPRASLEDGSKWTSIVSQFISNPPPRPKEKPCAPPRPDWAAISPGESR